MGRRDTGTTAATAADSAAAAAAAAASAAAAAAAAVTAAASAAAATAIVHYRLKVRHEGERVEVKVCVPDAASVCRPRDTTAVRPLEFQPRCRAGRCCFIEAFSNILL